MASLFTDRAIAYRATNEIPHHEVETAVVVQRMIEPDVSGVLFAADPMTGNRHTVSIEASLGLGEALVSGDVAGDTVRADRRTGEISEYEIGTQQLVARPLPGGGIETVELPPSERATRVLTDEQIHDLIEVGMEIEALFDRPQDIEWCLASGELSVVQSRPIMSLFPVSSPEPADDRLHVYICMGHGQAFAEVMPPLVCDLWNAYIESSLAEFGLDTETRRATEAGGRIYVDITPLVRIGPFRSRLPAALVGISGSIGTALENLLARRGEAFHAKRTARETLIGAARGVSAVWTGSRRGPLFVRQMLAGFVGAFIGEPTPEHEEEKWSAWGETMAAQIRAPDTPAERARAAFDVWDSATDIPSIGSLYAAFVMDVWLCRRVGNDPAVSDAVDAVGRGFPKELVTRINLGLGNLADVAREYPAVDDALKAGDSLDEIESCAGGEAFLDAFDKYLEEFGHRATGEMDISRLRWREDPSGLLATVRANLAGEAGEHREHLDRMEREANRAVHRIEAHADRGVFGPVRKRIIHRLVRTYRGYIQTWEYPKHGLAHLFSAWHEVLGEAGEVLAAEGQLADADDVWFLRNEELFRGLNGEPIEVDIEARRAQSEHHAGMDAPPVLTSEGEAPSARIERADIPDGALVGTGVSSGVVEGTARVVRDPTEETIDPGEILIAPSSDPGWTPLFLNAAGMVVEVGGRMSHGALVAREYGLPAVVSVPHATRRIETGHRVRVDGTNGTVERIE